MACSWAEQTSNLVEHNSILPRVPDPSSHPNGGGQNDKIKWNYVKLKGGMTMIEPVMGFYRNPPPLAKCRWTTNNGQHEPVMFEKNILKLPDRTLTKWNDEKLAAEASKYQELYWEEMKTLVRPESFEDLYEYFDSMTLWMNGAYNMWNLVNMLVTHAHNQMPLIRQEWKQAIDAYVYDFFYNHPYAYYNRQALCQWNGVGDPVNSIAFQNWPNFDLDGLNLEQENMAREALISQYIYLTGKQVNVPQYYPFFPRPVAENSDASRGAFNEVAPQLTAVTPAANTKPQKQATPLPVYERQGAALTVSGGANAKPVVAIGQPTTGRTSSPSAILTSIPEEPTTTANKAIETLTGSASSNPLELAEKTQDAAPKPQESAPKIVTKQATSERTEIIRDRKDSNGSSDKLFFNPDSSPDRLQVEGRSLSIVSAPDQGPEPMFDNTGAGNSKRCASEAPAVMRNRYETGQTNVQVREPSQVPAAVNMRRTSWQGPYKPASVQLCPMMEQGPPTDAHQHQHPNQTVPCQAQPMMGPSPPRSSYPPHHPQSTFGPPNAMMRPPPGPFSGPHGFYPGGGPPFTSGRDMTPGGRPLEMCHNQMPTRPPDMDTPQFGHPQGPPISMPPHLMGPPLQGLPKQSPPMYQENGYGPPTPRHNGGHTRFEGPGDKRNHNKKMGGRRDSVLSTGSRKVRDDPIHGAIYALKDARRGSSSNVSSGRAPSNGCDPDPEHGNVGVTSQCNNAWAQGRCYEELFACAFDECPCPRCAQATTSLFIALRGSTRIETQDLRNALMKQFAKFRPVSVKRKRSAPQALVTFQNDVDAIRAIQDACSKEDKTIKNLGVVGRVWYPLFSKHYTPNTSENPTGQPKQLFEVQSHMRSSDTRDRRDSNPFRSQPPTEQPIGRTFTDEPQGPIQHGSFAQPPPNMGQFPPPGFPAMNGVSYQPMGFMPPRTLWEPPASPRRQLSTAMSCAKVEQEHAATQPCLKTGQRTSEILMKEDWRSKPPSEEAIMDDNNDLPGTDTASNHSSQGSRSVKVSLPNEEGSAREAVSRDSSRSASPETGEQALKDGGKKHLKNEKEKVRVCNKTSATSSRTITPEKLKAGAAEVDSVAQEEKIPKTTTGDIQPKEPAEKKTSPGGYRKSTSDLAVPVESVEQPIAKSGYRKTAIDISSAVEKVYYPMETVIRHKPSRSTLPSEWAADMPRTAKNLSPANNNTFASSDTKERFASIHEDLRRAQMVSVVEKVSEAFSSPNAASMTDNAATSGFGIDAELDKQPKQAQKQRKKSKSKKGGKALGGKSNPASRSHTPNNVDVRVPSSESNRPPSVAALVGDATTLRSSSPVMQNNNTNDPSSVGSQQPKKKTKNKNKKRKPTQSASEFSEGLAKSEGSQDTKDQAVCPGSPLKKSKSTTDADSVEMAGKDAAECFPNNHSTKVVEQVQGQNTGGYRSNNGGSLRMNKQRTPKMVEQKDGPQDGKETKKPTDDAGTTSLATIFEPPVKEEQAKGVSPDANLFAHQKFTIDQTRKSSNQPKMQIHSAGPSANHQPMQEKGQAGSAPSNSPPFQPLPSRAGAWAAIVKGDVQSGKTDDPFVTGPGEAMAMSDDPPVKGDNMKSPQKEREADEQSSKDKPASPTLSPKKGSRQTSKNKGKSTLNAAVQSFVPSRASSAAAAALNAKLNPNAQSFTASIPSSPSMSVMSGVSRMHGSSIAVNTKKNNRSLHASDPTHNVEGGAHKGHAKKPSLPGQPTGMDKRFVTPAEQVVDPTELSQPGPPTKEKTKTGTRHDTLPDRTGGYPELPLIARPKPVPAMPVTAAKKMTTTPVKKAAEVVSNSPPPVTHDNFPTLDEAANTVAKKRTASIIKAGVPAVPTPSQAAMPDGGKADTTHNMAQQLAVSHQRSVTAPSTTKAQQPRQKPTEEQKPQDGSAWQIVGPARKNPGGMARGHGSRGSRGGRFWQPRGARGDRGSGAEERKGG